jgi:hypothetical protein
VVTIQPGLNSPQIEIIKNAFDLVSP